MIEKDLLKEKFVDLEIVARTRRIEVIMNS